jgi:hypothetical protein
MDFGLTFEVRALQFTFFITRTDNGTRSEVKKRKDGEKIGGNNFHDDGFDECKVYLMLCCRFLCAFLIFFRILW